MSFDNIPYKTISSKNSTTELPRELISKINEFKNNMTNETELRIKYALDHRDSMIDKFEKDINSTYKLLSVGLSNSGSYKVELPGSRSDFHLEPTLERWSQDNSEKYVVVQYFMEQFKLRGWNPTLKLSSYKYVIDNFMDTRSEYVGGDKIILECHFK